MYKTYNNISKCLKFTYKVFNYQLVSNLTY